MRQYYFTRDFILLFIANLLVTSVYFLLMTTMARYATETFNCSGSLAGLAASMFLVGGLLGRVVSGRFANVLGYKRMTVVSAVVMLAACALYFVSSANLVLLLAIRLVHGLTFGTVGTVMPAMAVMRFPKERMGEGTGVFMLSTSLGTAVGPLIGVFMAAGFGTSMSTGQAVVTKRVDTSKTALAIGTFFIMCDGGCGIGPVCLGALVDPLGFRGMYAVAAAACATALVYYHFAHGRKQAKRQERSL